MKLYKIAYNPDQNRKKIDRLEKDIKEIKKDIRSLTSDVKKAVKQLDSLNIGQRRYWQQQTVFTSLQRKIERFEKLEGEWVRYKKDMDAKMKRSVERAPRAQVGKLGK